MSVNDEKYQEMYGLLVEQLLVRPERVVANLNSLLQGKNINLELKLLQADPVVHQNEHLYQFPFMTGERKGWCRRMSLTATE